MTSKTNIYPRHTKGSNIKKHYTSLILGDEDLAEKTLLTVWGKADFKAGIDAGEVALGTTTNLQNVTIADGNEGEGLVLTSDSTGYATWKTKFFRTNDPVELRNGPSDGDIWTTFDVGIGVTNPDELLVVGGQTVGDGATLANINFNTDSLTTSTLSMDALKGDSDSFILRSNTSGNTILNGNTDINLSINNVSAVFVDSSGDVGIGEATPAAKLDVAGDAIIQGDLTVQGALTTIESTNVSITDSIIKMATGNTGNTIDSGFYSVYDTNTYSGVIRDASDAENKYIFFDNATTEPSTTLSGLYDYAPIHVSKLYVESDITSTNAVTFAHDGLTFDGTTGDVYFTNDGKVGVGLPTPDDTFAVSGTGYFSGNVGIGTTSQAVSLFIDTTDAVRLPSGTTLQRPTPQEGYFRFNSDLGVFEGHNGTSWDALNNNSQLTNLAGDTYITVEALVEEDYIRMFTQNNEIMTISDTGFVGINNNAPLISLDISGTDAIQLPVGTTLERPATVTGRMRYNTDRSTVEAYDGSVWVSLSGLSDEDGDTYITPENTPDEDALRFFTAGTEKMSLISTGQLGLGVTNPTVSVEVGGTDSILLPSGTTLERPVGVEGYIRHNSETSNIEAYTNGSWQVLNGLSGASGNTYIEIVGDEIKFWNDNELSQIIDATGNVGIGTTTPSTALDVNGTGSFTDILVSNDLTVSGNLTVDGTVTTINTTNVNVTDPLLHLAVDNSANLVDTGIYDVYIETGTTKYSGIFRDATDNKFKMFTGLEVAPTTTVNTAGTGYTKGIVSVGTLETEILKYTSTNLTINNSSDTTVGSFTNGGFFNIGSGTASYPLHVTTTNTTNWSGRFTNGTSDVFLANDSINGALINSGAGDANTSYALQVRNNDSQNILYVRNDKIIGINTDTPNNVLHINTTTSGEGIQSGIGFLGNQSGTVMMTSHQTYAGSITNFSTSQTSTGLTSINSVSGQPLNFQINGSTVGNFTSTGNLVLGTPSATSSLLNVGGSTLIDGDLVVDASTLKVDSSNNRVGINNSIPLSSLHISTTDGVKISDIGLTNDTEMLGYYPGTGAAGQDRYFTQGFFAGTTFPHSIRHRTYDSNTLITHDVMTVTLDGNLGIGTTNPTQLLDVNGNMMVKDGVLFVDSSTNRVGINDTTPTFDLDVNGNARFTGDVTIEGELDITGSISESLIIKDPLIKLSDNNLADLTDIGFYGEYNDGVNQVFTGLFRDATDTVYKLFESLEEEPTTTVNTAGTGYALADLELNDLTASGDVTANSFLSVSDMRVKENIQEIDYKTLGKSLIDLNIYNYNLTGNDETDIGIIAQELEEAVPELVKTQVRKHCGEKYDDFKTVKQNSLIIGLLASIKYLADEVKELKK